MLEQLGVEVVVAEVAVQEHHHRVLPCVARGGYQQRLRRRLRVDATGRRAPRGLLDLGKAGAVASMVEHVACRRHGVKQSDRLLLVYYADTTRLAEAIDHITESVCMHTS